MTLDTTTGREEVLAELRSGDKFLLTTHENPDGDALGSLVAMNEILRALGKDTVMFMSARGVPAALRVPLAAARRTHRTRCPPTPRSARSCSSTAATSTACRSSFLGRDDAHIVNIDHHHDNTRFGTANLVVDGASCTAEIIWEPEQGPRASS